MLIRKHSERNEKCVICDLATVHHVVVPPVDRDGQLGHAVRVRHFGKCLKKYFFFYIFPSNYALHLCGDVVSLPVPLEGGQGVAMVGVAGESELVPLPQGVFFTFFSSFKEIFLHIFFYFLFFLPQGVGRQAGDARSLRWSQDLDCF